MVCNLQTIISHCVNVETFVSNVSLHSMFKDHHSRYRIINTGKGLSIMFSPFP